MHVMLVEKISTRPLDHVTLQKIIVSSCCSLLGVFRDLESWNGDKVTVNLPVMDNFHLTLQDLDIDCFLAFTLVSPWQYYQSLQKKEELTAGTQGIPYLNIFLENMNMR